MAIFNINDEYIKCNKCGSIYFKKINIYTLKKNILKKGNDNSKFSEIIENVDRVEFECLNCGHIYKKEEI